MPCKLALFAFPLEVLLEVRGNRDRRSAKLEALRLPRLKLAEDSLSDFGAVPHPLEVSRRMLTHLERLARSACAA